MRGIAMSAAIDPEFNMPAIELATQMIMELCGGEPSNVVVAGEVPNTDRAYKLDAKRVISLVGHGDPRRPNSAKR